MFSAFVVGSSKSQGLFLRDGVWRLIPRLHQVGVDRPPPSGIFVFSLAAATEPEAELADRVELPTPAVAPCVEGALCAACSSSRGRASAARGPRPRLLGHLRTYVFGRNENPEASEAVLGGNTDSLSTLVHKKTFSVDFYMAGARIPISQGEEEGKEKG